MNRHWMVAPVILLAACSTENARVREARDQFYSAISRYDQAAVRSAVVPEYLAVDRGRSFNVDSLLSDLVLYEQESLAVHYTFSDSVVHVYPPVAWAMYRERRIFSRPHAADTAYNLETALFRREGSDWKVVMIHRTPVTSNGTFPGDSTRAAAPPPAPAPPASRTPSRQ